MGADRNSAHDESLLFPNATKLSVEHENRAHFGERSFRRDPPEGGMKGSKRESLGVRDDQSSDALPREELNLSCGRPRALFASIDRGAGKPSADYLR